MAFGSTAEELELAKKLEAEVKEEFKKSKLQQGGFIKKFDGDKFRFGNLAVQDGRRVFVGVDSEQLGEDLVKILDAVEKYLNKITPNAKATKGVSGIVTLGNVTKAILQNRLDPNVPRLAGKYFEWCVYAAFCRLLKKYDSNVKAGGERESFYNQKFYLMPYRAKYPTLMPQIEQLAVKAVNNFFDFNGKQNMKSWAVKVLAGANKTGDLVLYNENTKRTIILELKLYRQPQRIHYATLNDMSNFGFSYMAIMRRHKSFERPVQGLTDEDATWYSHVSSKEPLVGPKATTFDAWINHIHGRHGAEYMMDSIMKRGRINGINVKTEAAALNYFMQKGDPVLQQWNTKKQAIIGIRVDHGSKNAGKIEALFDIDFLEPSRDIHMSYDKNGVTFAYGNADNHSNVILSANATEESLRKWAEKMDYVIEEKAAHPDGEGLPKDAHWNSLPEIKLELQMYQAYWQSKGKI